VEKENSVSLRRFQQEGREEYVTIQRPSVYNDCFQRRRKCLGNGSTNRLVETNVFFQIRTYCQPKSFSILHNTSAFALQPSPEGSSVTKVDIRSYLEVSGQLVTTEAPFQSPNNRQKLPRYAGRRRFNIWKDESLIKGSIRALRRWFPLPQLNRDQTANMSLGQSASSFIMKD